MKVVRLEKKYCKELIEKKHYSRKLSIFWKGYGLIEDNRIVGVIVYGQPSPPLQKYAFENRDFRFYELSRLVIQTKTKNAASYLIGNSLKLLEPKPCAVVSFADSAYNHCGFVYQATNWLYTGATKSHDSLYLINGKLVHSISLRDKGITSPKKWATENNIEIVRPKEKYRYFYFVGNKKDKRMMVSKLKYKIINKYPKIDSIRYDDGDIIDVDYCE